jgi:hypothetical protein
MSFRCIPVASLPPGLGTAPATTEPLTDRAMQAMLGTMTLDVATLKNAPAG